MHARWSLAAALLALSLAVPGVAAAGPSTGDALIFRTPNGDLKLFDSASRQPLRTLPPGVLSADGKTLLTAQVRGKSTLLRRVTVASGRVIAHRTIPGRWSFQVAAADGTLVAGGDRGEPIALVTAARARGYLGDARTTRIALLSSDLAGELQVLTLPGNFGVDAVGPDSHYLYLVQHLVGEHYQVRAYDMLARKLVAQPVVSKTEPNEKMQGLPLARAASPTGNMVLTLYRKPSGMPFVHALFANALYAVCIDLPASARVDPRTRPRGASRWRGTSSTSPTRTAAGSRPSTTPASRCCAPPRSGRRREPASRRDRSRRARTARPCTSRVRTGSSRSPPRR